MSSRRTRTGSPGAFAVVGARIALLLLAMALAASGFALARARGGGAGGAGAAEYTCPMHPEVVADAPDDCPLCHMALVPLEPAAQAARRAPEHGSADEPFSLPRGVRPADHQRLGAAERRVFASKVMAPAWIDADGTASAVLHEEELIGLSPGDVAQFAGARSPRDGLRAVRLDEAPARRADGSVVVRFRIDPALPAAAAASASAPASGDVGWLRIDAKPREVSVIPLSAVLYGADGPFVLVAQADRQRFVRRPVRLGRVYAGRVAVLDGLGDRDLIALGNVFLLDAERRQARHGASKVGP